MTEDTKQPHLTATLLLACLAQFMVVLDVSVVNVALPSIRSGLHFSEVDLQWVVNAYTVTFAGFLLLGGRAADLLGRRKVFVAGLVLFALSSLIGGLADSQAVLVGARAAQGLGAAVIAPASLSILTTTFAEGPERNRAVGIWGAMGGTGGATGAILGGLLTEVSWRWILFINVPIGLIAAVLATRLIMESRREHAERSFDLLGATTATVGLTLLVLGIVRTDQTGWGSAPTLALIVAGIALLAGFVLIEGRFSRYPLMPLRIWSSRTLSAANVIVLTLGGGAFAMWFFLSLYLQQVLGYSPVQTGLAFLPMTGMIVICSTLASRVVGRVGVRPLLLIAMASLAGGLVWFTGLPVKGDYLADMLVPSLLVSVGIGLGFVTSAIAATAGVHRSEAGLASGLVNTGRMLGGALGLAILATIATSRTDHELAAGASAHSALTSGFHLGFLVGACFAVAGALVAAFGLPHVRTRAGEDQAPAAAPQPEHA